MAADVEGWSFLMFPTQFSGVFKAGLTIIRAVCLQDLLNQPNCFRDVTGLALQIRST